MTDQEHLYESKEPNLPMEEANNMEQVTSAATAKKYQLPCEFGEKWVAALRSGDFEQGRGALIRGGIGNYRFCCIAVGAKVCGAEDAELFRPNGMSAALLTFRNTQEAPIMRSEILAKIPNAIIGGTHNELVAELANMNDRDNKSFPQIADWIEQNVEFV